MIENVMWEWLKWCISRRWWWSS